MTGATAWADELPAVELPSDPAWRENYCFDAYDHERDIGYWIHMGRWPADPTIWREQVLVYLPGGEFLLHRGWGRRESPSGPSGSSLDLVCEEPGTTWRIRYHGPARRTRQSELTATLPETAQELLDLDVAFTSPNDLWVMGDEVDAQSWASAHAEHTGRATGRISFGGRSTPLDAVAWRDHSRGARNLRGMQRHCWIHGDLPGGRSFALTDVESREDSGSLVRFTECVIWDGGQIVRASCPQPPYLTSHASTGDRYAMVLESDIGTFEIDAEIRRTLPHSTMANGDAVDGVARADAHLVTWEQGTVFHVDGKAYGGHSERSHRIPVD